MLCALSYSRVDSVGVFEIGLVGREGSWPGCCFLGDCAASVGV